MKQRLTTLLTVVFLTLGTGGAIAWSSGVGRDAGGSASFDQYKPPCDHGKGRGGDHECHGHEGEKGGGDKGGDKGGPGGGDKGGDKGGQGGGDKGPGPGGHDQGGHGDKGGHGHH